MFQTSKNEDYFYIRYIFIRLISIIYFFAFLSLYSQILGLIGSNGILPINSFLSSIRNEISFNFFLSFPTLCWFNSSDLFLQIQCILGIIFSVLLIIDFAPAAMLFFLWALYLSLTNAGTEFLSYQMDNLLIETGFLAIFFAPIKLFPKTPYCNKIPDTILWLLRWLLFRLIIQSGLAKLLSGDITWRSLTALNYHYETQPLPTWASWYFYKLPDWFHKTSVLSMFIIEIIVPVLIFAPKKYRIFASFALIFLQVLIALTGNYCFFNFLTIILCLLLLNDSFVPSWLKKKIVISENASKNWPNWIIILVLCVILSVTFVKPLLVNSCRISIHPLIKLERLVAPFRSVNIYGIFAVMTTKRPEIIIEGSNDGRIWIPYEFKYKMGRLNKRPGFVAPHQPRLDWQMWFAAMNTYRENPWFINLCIRLLEGCKDVINLLDKNPFPDKPPHYVRALLYNYQFTNSFEKNKTGNWWKRKFIREYFPAISLEDGKLVLLK